MYTIVVPKTFAHIFIHGTGHYDEKWATGTRHICTKSENMELMECYYNRNATITLKGYMYWKLISSINSKNLISSTARHRRTTTSDWEIPLWKWWAEWHDTPQPVTTATSSNNILSGAAPSANCQSSFRRNVHKRWAQICHNSPSNNNPTIIYWRVYSQLQWNNDRKRSTQNWGWKTLEGHVGERSITQHQCQVAGKLKSWPQLSPRTRTIVTNTKAHSQQWASGIKNWAASAPDMIHTYWLKKLRHSIIVCQLKWVCC